MPDQTAEMTATALIEHWISPFGVTVSIHTGQGRSFESKLFQSLMQSLQIKRELLPSTNKNPVIERMNQTTLKILAKTVEDFQSNWTQQLQFVMMAFPTSVQESTGCTPVSYFWQRKKQPH